MSDQHTKDRIFREAAILFAERGYNGVSVREVCERSDVSKPTLYYYFGSKEGLYESLVDTGINLNAEKLRGILAQKIPVKDKLVELVKLSFQNAIQYPELIKFSQSLLISMDRLPFLDQYIATAKERRRMLADLISQGIKNGEFGASARPELACDVFFGSITHFIWKQLNMPKTILTDKLAEDIVELLFKGLNE